MLDSHIKTTYAVFKERLQYLAIFNTNHMTDSAYSAHRSQLTEAKGMLRGIRETAPSRIPGRITMPEDE